VKYDTAEAFRAALDQRIRNEAITTKLPGAGPPPAPKPRAPHPETRRAAGLKNGRAAVAARPTTVPSMKRRYMAAPVRCLTAEAL